MMIFVQNQGMRKNLPQAYIRYSEDKIISHNAKVERKERFAKGSTILFLTTDYANLGELAVPFR
jgi:hypothetical protein